jgi:hypothetical protein
MYEPTLWRDYFVMVGGGAAALTGLVFVAMSLHLDDIASDPAHRHRARTILAGLTAVFIRCGLVLMGGQGVRAVGVEIVAVLVGVEIVLFRSFADAVRNSPTTRPGVRFRALGSFACLLVEQVGAVILILGHASGLYAVGVGMMASFVFVVSGAWLLLVGVEPTERMGT